MRLLAVLPAAFVAALAPTAHAQDDVSADSPIGVAVVVSADGIADDTLRETTLLTLCDRLPASGFFCAPDEEVRAALGESGARPGPDVLERLAEQLDLPYAVAVVLYPGAEEGQFDADVFLQVHDRSTGIFRSATSDADDAAETAAETAEGMLRDAESRGFGSGTVDVPGGDAGDLGAGPPADDGLVDLAVNLTLQGTSVAYLATSSFSISDWRIIGPTLFMGAGAGVAAALLADYYLPISVAEATVVGAGGWWGLLEGGLLALTLGAGGFDEISPWGLLGWGVGLGTGITLAATIDLTKGDIALTNSAAAWGTFAGAVIAGTILGRDIFTTSRDYDYALPFAGLNAGLLSGILTSIWVDISRSRMALIDLSGLLGVLLGGSLGTPLIFEDPSDDDKRWYSAIMLVSAAAGLGIGALITDGMDDDDGPAAAAMIEVEPAGAVSLHIPIPRPWIDPAPPPPNRLASPLGIWVGLAEGSW